MDATRHSESESHAHHKSSIVSSDAVAVKIEGASQSILDVKGSSGSVDLDALLEEDFDGILSTSQHATKLDETTDAQGGVEPIETCEIGRTQARGLLESLLKRFKGARVHTSQMAGYSQDISETLKSFAQKKTIVGVMGNTGAGKSSIINALLDEEQLVPTSCMRACTAVVTEISFNNGDEKYRAEIEFINPKEWESELGILSRDLVDAEGSLRRDTSDDSTNAGKAYTKIKAVYPKFSKEKMSQTSLSEYLQHGNVRDILGSTKRISDTDSLRFHQTLQRFVDSEDRNPISLGIDDSGTEKVSNMMEFWPLIRVVRLYVKHAALENGAIIVDLPGSHDSNAARAAVAAQYMRECTGLWIVSPSSRAVSDKAAKNLLGDSFKRQLLMDGSYNAVTFICSKTDQIGIQEALSSLPGLKSAFERIKNNTQALEQIKGQIEFEIQSLKRTRSESEESFRDLNDEWRVWSQLQRSFEHGEVVYAPRTNRKQKQKRKHHDDAGGNNKKLRQDPTVGNPSEDSEIDSDLDSDSEEPYESSDLQAGRDPLNKQQIEESIAQIDANIKLVKKQNKEALEIIRRKRHIVNNKIAQKLKDNEASKVLLCINGRNEYSKEHIRGDFANGLREIDEQIMAEEEPAKRKTSAPPREYDQIAAALPVFCVSSKAYLKLSGKLLNDPSMGPGLRTIEDTNIPQLQEHCKQLTLTGRTAAARNCVTQACRIYNSLMIWARDISGEIAMTEKQEVEMRSLIAQGVEELKKDYNASIVDTVATLRKDFETNIYKHLLPAKKASMKAALKTFEKWSLDRSEGGIHFQTWKAICRREGVYTTQKKKHHWNNELSMPMTNSLLLGWERTFTKRVPAATTGLSMAFKEKLKKFHNHIEAEGGKRGASIASLAVLTRQLRIYDQTFETETSSIKQFLVETQKDASRGFAETVRKHMASAYKNCDLASGPGVAKEMKEIIEEHLQSQGPKMFNACAKSTKAKLEEMLKEATSMLETRVDKLLAKILVDYDILADSRSRHESQENLNHVRETKNKILRTLEGTPEHLKKILLDQSVIVDKAVPVSDGSAKPQLGSDGHIKTEEGAYVKRDSNEEDADGEDEASDPGEVTYDHMMEDVESLDDFDDGDEEDGENDDDDLPVKGEPADEED